MKIEIDFDKESCETHYHTIDKKTGKIVKLSIIEINKFNVKPIINAFEEQISDDAEPPKIESFFKDVKEELDKKKKHIINKRTGK